MTVTLPSSAQEGVPLPRLSDEAAVEIYLFVEHVFLLVESRYGDQIRRHFDEFSQHNLIGSGFDPPLDDPPF
ncbi:MAG: hypothetical protein RLZZ598_212 [Pseudomonadota bacterium]|jgi:hypothetical protein